MARQNRRRVEGVPTPSGGSLQREDEWQGEAYVVRTVTGALAAKPYRCPGCDQMIPARVPHLVAWPADDDDATHRRHWHSACWDARDRRRPVR